MKFANRFGDISIGITCIIHIHLKYYCYVQKKNISPYKIKISYSFTLKIEFIYFIVNDFVNNRIYINSKYCNTGVCEKV